jgi:hypothetical protein
MKKLLWFTVMLMLAAARAQAAPCVSASLDAYVGLGSVGCTVAGVTFADFSIVDPISPGVAPIAPGDVTLTPLSLSGEVGLALSSATSVSATAGEILQLWFGFATTAGVGTFFTGNSLALGPSIVEPDGAITIVEDKCLGGSFASPSAGCGGTPLAPLSVFDIGVLSETGADAVFGAPLSFFDVYVDVVIDGGLAGTATLGPELGQIRAALVPEPSAAWFVAAGLILLLCSRRFRRSVVPH